MAHFKKVYVIRQREKLQQKKTTATIYSKRNNEHVYWKWPRFNEDILSMGDIPAIHSEIRIVEHVDDRQRFSKSNNLRFYIEQLTTHKDSTKLLLMVNYLKWLRNIQHTHTSWIIIIIVITIILVFSIICGDLC